MNRFKICLLVSLVVTLGAFLVLADAFLNFEGFPDSTILTTQYPGETFSNAIILTAGITLNEFEFPPHSGSNVASDNNGPLSISFASSVSSFSGFFTHSVPLSLTAFDSSNRQVATAASRFSNNEALSGSSGSSSNELLQASSANGFSRVTITGSPAGSSFTLDDATLITATAQPLPTTPAPPTLILTLLGLGCIGLVAYAGKKFGFAFMAMLSMVFAVLSFGIGAFWLYAAPQASRSASSGSQQEPRIEGFSVSRTVIPVRTPSTVTVSARINHPSHITNSVNLIRINPSGLPTILGQMHGDANNGDSTAGDHVYAIHVTLDEPGAGQVRLQVSAAFRGRVKRELSDPLILTVRSQQ